MEDVLRSMDMSVIWEDLDSLKSSRISLSLKRRKEVRSAFQKLIKQSARQDNPYTESRTKLHMAQLLMSISEYIKDSPKDNGPIPQDAVVKKVIGCMDANHDKPITPDYLEEWLSISKYHISRVFERSTGFTITEYLKTRRAIETWKRLDNSERILGTTTDTE